MYFNIEKKVLVYEVWGAVEAISCLQLYVHRCTESEVDDEAGESGEFVVVTEVWTEPQYGFVANSTPERRHYDGCSFSNWPDKVR